MSLPLLSVDRDSGLPYVLSNPGFFSGRQTKRDSRSVIEQRGDRNHDEAREHDPGPILSNNGTCKHLRRRR